MLKPELSQYVCAPAIQNIYTEKKGRIPPKKKNVHIQQCYPGELFKIFAFMCSLWPFFPNALVPSVFNHCKQDPKENLNHNFDLTTKLKFLSSASRKPPLPCTCLHSEAEFNFFLDRNFFLRSSSVDIKGDKHGAFEL